MLLLKKANLLFVTHGSEKRYCTRPMKDFTEIEYVQKTLLNGSLHIGGLTSHSQTKECFITQKHSFFLCSAKPIPSGYTCFPVIKVGQKCLLEPL